VALLLLAAGASMAVPPLVRAQPAGAPVRTLTLDDALRLFHERGFDLVLADTAVAAAAGDLTAAKAFPNPVIGGGGGHTYDYRPHGADCSGCSQRQWTASLNDSGLLFDLVIGKRRLAIDVAKAALAGAQHSRADAERTLVAAVKEAYVDAVVARALLDTSRETAESAQRTADLVQLRFHAGDVAEADAARAETSRLEAEQAVDAAHEVADAANVALAFWIGEREGSVDFEVARELPAPDEPPALATATIGDLVASARQKRPDLAAAQAGVESAQSALALERRKRIPDVALTGGYTQEGTGQEALQPPTASLGITLPLPVFDRNAGGIARAEVARPAQWVRRPKLHPPKAGEVAGARAAPRTALERVERMNAGLLVNARRARDLVEYQYKRGAASLLELLDAERSFAATRAEAVQSLGDYWSSRYRIEEAVGMEIGS